MSHPGTLANSLVPFALVEGNSNRCPSGHTNEPAARFCATCGQEIPGFCANGHEMDAAERFCGTCGAGRAAPLLAPMTPRTLSPAITEPPARAEQRPRSGRRPETTPEEGTAAIVTGSRRRSGARSPRMLPLLGGAVVLAVGLVLLFDRGLIGGSAPHPRTSDTSSSSTFTSPTGSSGPSGDAGPTTQAQAAAELGSLLQSSTQDRSSIVAAVTNVSNCTGSLSADKSIFLVSAASRLTLLDQLSSLEEGGLLPRTMLTDLKDAWTASVAADTDFAGWTQDRITRGCAATTTSDPHLLAADAPDAAATTYKEAFVSLWNPLAQEYGLTQYSWQQL